MTLDVLKVCVIVSLFGFSPDYATSTLHPKSTGDDSQSVAAKLLAEGAFRIHMTRPDLSVRVKCMTCYKPFKVDRSRLLAGKGKYCSKACMHANSERTAKIKASVQRNWDTTRKGFKHTKETRAKQSKALSNRILSETHVAQISTRMRGNKNPSWKGGITPLHLKIRNHRLYRQWRKVVIARDSGKCQQCGSTSNPEADHHPILFSELLDQFGITCLESAILCPELWEISNGRTLCEQCHFKKSGEDFKRIWKRKLKSRV